jgi:hypothetical protein
MGDIANTISPQDRATIVAFYQLSANPEAEFDLCARYQRMSVFYALYFKLNGKVKLMLTKEENHDQSSLMAIAGTKQELDDTQDIGYRVFASEMLPIQLSGLLLGASVEKEPILVPCFS